MDRDEHSALIDNMRSMYFGPNNSNSIRDLCYTMGDNMRDDDSQNQWLSDCSSDSDDEPDPHPYCDASGNKIRETISQKNQRITGRSSHFLPLPLDFNRNEVIVDISKMGKSSRYGVRIENDEEGNPVQVWGNNGSKAQKWQVLYLDEADKDRKKGFNKEFGLHINRPFYIVSELPFNRVAEMLGGTNMVLKRWRNNQRKV